MENTVKMYITADEVADKDLGSGNPLNYVLALLETQNPVYPFTVL